jgi:3-hydroxyisobutyrate dehydrogenase-like beta-hydroxyacid dehydrogenase
MGDRVGLIGAGLAGSALADNLLSRGFQVVGYDVSEERRSFLARAGAGVATDPCSVASDCDRVLLSLPDSDVVREVIEGAHGILASDPLPRFVIDTTTGDPEQTVELAATLSARNVVMLDATISGSSKQVSDREAILMVGGPADAYEACRDVLDALAERHFHMGPVGSGSRAKLASNLILGLNRLVLAEGLVFAEGLGLDLESFLTVLKSSPAYSRAMDVKGEKMIRGDFTPQSRVRQHHKDLRLILQSAERMNRELPLTLVHKRILERAMDAGDADLDSCVVIRHLAGPGGPGADPSRAG